MLPTWLTDKYESGDGSPLPLCVDYGSRNGVWYGTINYQYLSEDRAARLAADPNFPGLRRKEIAPVKGGRGKKAEGSKSAPEQAPDPQAGDADEAPPATTKEPADESGTPPAHEQDSE